MDSANYNPSLLPLLLKSPFFAERLFTLIDVGCSGGLDPLWRLFGNHLEAHGFDPQRDECDRLRDQETNSNVRYHPFFVGLDPAHPFHLRKRAVDFRVTDHFYSGWHRSSSALAQTLGSAVPLQSNTVNVNLSDQRISVSDFVRREHIQNVDFVKIDTDGGDLEVALSSAEIVRPTGVLGFMVESPFTGGADETENSFHNIDRFMRSQGFALFHLTLNRYSRRALPAPFVHNILAQTRAGQVLWGDALYLRDPVAPHFHDLWEHTLTTEKLVKLAMLYDLFSLPDCAAELIVTYRNQFAEIIDPTRLLDSLTPPLRDCPQTYQQHTERFRHRMESFFPQPVAPHEPEPITAVDESVLAAEVPRSTMPSVVAVGKEMVLSPAPSPSLLLRALRKVTRSFSRS